MYFPTVYYSHFWYSRFLNLSPQSLDGRSIRGEVDRHVACFRLLALFFENIYVPRTHLLTQVVPLQTEISEVVLAHRDAVFLREAGALLLSASPGLDGHSDTERITSRAAHTSDVTYPRRRAYLKALASGPTFTVEGGREAMSNTITFPQYARWLELSSPHLSQKVIAIVDHAQIRDVPFFHERFVSELKSQLGATDFDKVWRDTNSLYLTTGVPTQAGGIPYFNDTIESASYRYDPLNVDRYLFNPVSLYAFTELLIGRDSLAAFLEMPIERVLEVLMPSGSAARFTKPFREAYCSLVNDISRATRNPFGQGELTLTNLAGWYGRALDGNSAARVAALEGALEDSGTIVQALDPSAGLIKSATRPIIRYGKGAFERYLRRRRNPAIYDFADVLTARIQKA
jgi:hypothetical protein